MWIFLGFVAGVLAFCGIGKRRQEFRELLVDLWVIWALMVFCASIGVLVWWLTQ